MPREPTIARINIKGQRFEILVDPDKAFKYKFEGEKIDISEILFSEFIFEDAKKGLRSSTAGLMRAFGTTDPLKIAEIILRKGTLQIREEQRRRLIEAKRRQIISYISRNCVDARTNTPLPPARVESLLSELKVSIDPFEDATVQAEKIIKLIATVIPIRRETVRVYVKLPPQYAPRAYGPLREAGEILEESWGADGSLSVTVRLPIASLASLTERLVELSRGTAIIKVLD